jgi:hypothetical protein
MKLQEQTEPIIVRNPARLFAAPAVKVTRRKDGTVLLSSARSLGSHPCSLGYHLIRWAQRAPDRPYFNLILRNGGTLYIDAGRPIPSRFDRTLENLRDISPTLYGDAVRFADPGRPEQGLVFVPERRPLGRL